MKKFRIVMVCFLLLTVVVNTGFAGNSFNPKFNYQGKVIFNGSPAHGDFEVTFNLFDTVTNGLIQDSINQTLSIENGLINTELDFMDFPAFFERAWLEISIQDPATLDVYTLEPRVAINTAPYAIKALKTDFVADNSITSLSVIDSSLLGLDFANNAIGLKKLSTNGASDGDIIQYNTTSAEWESSAIGNVTNPWNNNNNGIDYTAGNVGIGTTNPTGLLHIQGSSSDELQLFGGSSSPVIHFRRTINSSDWVLKQDPTGGKFHIQSELVAGNEVMTLDNSGKVGIGTTSPTGVLDVRDNAGDTLLNVFSSGAITRKVVTRSLTLGYPSFQSSDSTRNYKEVLNVGTVDGFQNNPQSLLIDYLSPLLLPSGAKIISMSVLAFDDDPAAEITTSIYQSPFSTSGPDNLVARASTGAVPGAVIVTDDIINHSVIAEHSYYILVEIPAQAIASTDLLFSAVRIRYEIGVL